MAVVKWTPALAAAVIDTEIDGHSEAFSRDHVVALKNAGCTRAEVRAYLVSIYANKKIRRGGQMVSAVDHVLSDLDTYGSWPRG